jgi:acetyl-CoA C-acetyltransferase
MTPLDPRTPVVVGVGQASERLTDPGYAQLSPVELAAAAALEALQDTGVDPSSVAAAVQVLAATRQFENSSPGAVAPFGRSDNVPRSIAGRLGCDPSRAVVEVSGGQSPQHLVNEFAAEIAAGAADVVLVAGAEAISTVRAGDVRDWSEQVGGQLEDRGFGLEGLVSTYQSAHGLTGAPSQYALFETARRARLGMSRESYVRSMAELFAPFTEVAAANPHAAAPAVLTVDELATPTQRNRPVADPYTRFFVSRDQVNQGAAVVLMSVATAQRLGISPERWVFLHGHADLRERDLLDRSDLSRGPASVMAVQHALEVAGIGVDDLSDLDLYSCFPIAVSNICDGLGLSPSDPRGLTVTGGLPFFGGAGNNYSMHAIAEIAQRARATPGSYGLVGANGGALSKYSVGVYSSTPTGWRPDRSAELQSLIAQWPAPPRTEGADGWATIETCTVKYGRDHRTGIVVGRLEGDGARFLAKSVPGDEALLDLLLSEEPVGARVLVRSTEAGNRVTTTGD